MSKLKIFILTTQVANCGVGWYRMISPIRELEKKGLVEARVMNFNMGKKEVKLPYSYRMVGNKMTDVILEKKFLEGIKWADLVYVCRDESTPYLAVVGGLKEHFGKPFILDIDDYVQQTRPYNPGYLSFHPGSAFNKLNLVLFKIVDGVTTSTDYLKSVYKSHNNKIFVCPNSLEPAWRDKYLNIKPIVSKKNGEIRIGWAGSAAHWENLKRIEAALRDIMLKYPQVTFHYTGLFGDLFRWSDMEDRVRTVKFVDLEEWPKRLAQMGLDIALAPLADNHFNRAKSNLRVIEYWACKYPVIASDVLPYRCIEQGKDGYKVLEKHEWYARMEELILDEKKRRDFGESGYRRYKNEYNMEKNCMIWYDTFKKFIR